MESALLKFSESSILNFGKSKSTSVFMPESGTERTLYSRPFLFLPSEAIFFLRIMQLAWQFLLTYYTRGICRFRRKAGQKETQE